MVDAATKKYIVKIFTKGLKEAIDGMGSLNAQGEKLEQGYKKVNKAGATYHRTAQGVGDMTSNQTKAFAKAAQGLGGSTGLIQLYAGMAANIFAVGAAFRTLRDAFNYENQIRAAEAYGLKTGTSLTLIAQKMKEVTQGAISMQEAMSNVAISTSAGFDSSTIEKLTRVAKNASIALGRDLSDSLDRVFKGAIKAEPELLDELGIILRLKPATDAYASALGKAAKDLTTFEKQQAVVNAVLEQGEEKFGDIGEHIETNVYNQLASSFTELTKAGLTLINTVLVPVINFLTSNPGALVAVIALFAHSIITKALPAMDSFGASLIANFTDNFSKMANIAASTFGRLATTMSMNEVMENLTGSLLPELEKEFGGVTVAVNKAVKAFKSDSINDFSKATKNLNKSHHDLVTEFDLTLDASVVLNEAYDDIISSQEDYIKQTKLQNSTTVLATKTSFIYGTTLSKVVGTAARYAEVSLHALNRGLVAVSAGMSAGTKLSYHNALALVNTEGKTATQVMHALGIETEFTTGELKGQKTAYGNLANSLDNVTGKFGFLSKAIFRGSVLVGKGLSFLFKMVPIIGQLLFVWEVLGSAFSYVIGLFDDSQETTKKATEGIDAYTDAITASAEKVDHYDKNIGTLGNSFDVLGKKVEYQRNVLNDMSGSISSVIDEIEDADVAVWLDFDFTGISTSKLDELNKGLVTQIGLLERLGTDSDTINDLKKLSNDLTDESTAATLKLSLAMQKANKERLRVIANEDDRRKALSQSIDKVHELAKAYKTSFKVEGSTLEKFTLALSEQLANIGQAFGSQEKTSLLATLGEFENLFDFDLTSLNQVNTSLITLTNKASEFRAEIKTLQATLNQGYDGTLKLQLHDLTKEFDANRVAISNLERQARALNADALSSFGEKANEIFSRLNETKDIDLGVQRLNVALKDTSLQTTEIVALQSQLYGLQQRSLTLKMEEAQLNYTSNTAEIQARLDELQHQRNIFNFGTARQKMRLRHTEETLELEAKSLELKKRNAAQIGEELKIQQAGLAIAREMQQLADAGTLIEDYSKRIIDIETFNKLLTEQHITIQNIKDISLEKSKSFAISNRSLKTENKWLSQDLAILKAIKKESSNITGLTASREIHAKKMEAYRLSQLEGTETLVDKLYEEIELLTKNAELQIDITTELEKQAELEVIKDAKKALAEEKLELELLMAQTDEEKLRIQLEIFKLGLNDEYTDELKKQLALLESQRIAVENTATNYEEAVEAAEEAAEEIGSFFGDMFFSIFDEGIDGFRDFWRDVKTQFKKALADMIALGLQNAIKVNLVSSISGGGGVAVAAGGFGNLIGGLTSSIGSLVSSVGSFLGSGGFATGASAAGANLIGGGIGSLSGGGYLGGLGGVMSGMFQSLSGFTTAIGYALPVIGAVLAIATAFGVFDDEEAPSEINMRAGPKGSLRTPKESRKPGKVAFGESTIGALRFNIQHSGNEGQMSDEDAQQFVKDVLQPLINTAILIDETLVEYLSLTEDEIAVLTEQTTADIAREMDKISKEGKSPGDFLAERLRIIFENISAPLEDLYDYFAIIEDPSTLDFAQMGALVNALIIMDSAVGDLRATFGFMIKTLNANGDAFDDLAKEGEPLAAAVARLGTEFTQVNFVMQALRLTLFDLSVAGIEASQDLITFVGGMETLSELAKFYAENFLSSTEQFENVITTAVVTFANLTSQFDNLNIDALPKTREEFRKLIEQASSIGDTELLAQLLKIAPIFDVIYDKIEEQTGNTASLVESLTGQIERQVEIAETLLDTLNSLVDGFNDLINSIEEDIVSLSKVEVLDIDELKKQLYSEFSFDDTEEAANRLELAEEYREAIFNTMNEQIGLLEEQLQIVEKLKDIGQDLIDTVDDIRMNEQISPLTTGERLRDSQAEFQRLLGLAQGGDADAAQKLIQLGPDLLQLAAEYFGGTASSQYQDIFNIITGSMETLGNDLIALSTEDILKQIEDIEQQALEELKVLAEWAKSVQAGLQVEATAVEAHLVELKHALAEQTGELSVDLWDIGKMITDAIEALDLSLFEPDPLVNDGDQPDPGTPPEPPPGTVGDPNNPPQGSTDSIPQIPGDQSPLPAGVVFKDLLGDLPLFECTGGSCSTAEMRAWGASNNIPTWLPLGVDWYKDGGIFDSPSIIGVGDANRTEAVVPMPDGSSIPVTINNDESYQMFRDTMETIQLQNAVMNEELIEEIQDLRQEVANLKNTIGQPITEAVNMSGRRHAFA